MVDALVRLKTVDSRWSLPSRMGCAQATIGARLGAAKSVVACPRKADKREERLAEIRALAASATARNRAVAHEYRAVLRRVEGSAEPLRGASGS